MADATYRIEYQELSNLLAAPRNPKKHDTAALRDSMNRFGFTQPIAINERTGRMVEGHGRLDVLKQMQADKSAAPIGVQVKGGKWLVPVLRGLEFKNEAEAEAYLLAANQITIAGGWDEGMLASTLAELQTATKGFTGLGFDQGALDNLLKDFQAASATIDQSVAPIPAAPAPIPTVATPAPIPTAAAPAPIPSMAAPAPASAEKATPAAAARFDDENRQTASDASLAIGIADGALDGEDDGILDPIDRTLTKGDYSSSGEAVRFMRYAIPLTPDESALLEHAVEEWVRQTGGLFGFIRHILTR